MKADEKCDHIFYNKLYKSQFNEEKLALECTLYYCSLEDQPRRFDPEGRLYTPAQLPR